MMTHYLWEMHKVIQSKTEINANVLFTDGQKFQIYDVLYNELSINNLIESQGITI